ncbi:hypothetical protein MRB53_040630 [Persea americana]|nr:hypothetical protein MRB53_040630 [Persea americana]
MSTERSSSAVRNLRSIFESKESEREASEIRAHSGSRAASREGRSRPLSKVRSSFVAVERPSMASTAEQTDGGGIGKESVVLL